jgi:methionyl-tRNA synthetase
MLYDEGGGQDAGLGKCGEMNLLNTGYPLRAPELLFRKIEDAEIEAQVQKLRAGSIKPTTLAEVNEEVKDDIAPAHAPLKPEITFDDFAKIDLRIGTIRKAEKVAKADKLLQLEVDLGFETRTIVSGIAMHFNPEELVGKQVTVVANLAPRKMRGIESQGMLLLADNAGGQLVFISPEKETTPGSEVK